VARAFNLTPRAKEDLRGIWNYTADVWDEARADHYIKELFERFDKLAQHPRMGKHRPNIQEGYYSFPHASHLVFYLIAKNDIHIIGVPHKEMDVISYFDDST